MKLVIQRCAIIFILLLQNSLSYGDNTDCMYEPGEKSFGTISVPKDFPTETLTLKGKIYYCCASKHWNMPDITRHDDISYDCRKLVNKSCDKVQAENSANCNKDTKKLGEQ